jgi:hypothetical protein
VKCSLALMHGVLAGRIFFISHILAMNIFLFKVYIFHQNLFMYMNVRIVMDVFNPVGIFLSEVYGDVVLPSKDVHFCSCHMVW